MSHDPDNDMSDQWTLNITDSSGEEEIASLDVGFDVIEMLIGIGLQHVLRDALEKDWHSLS